MLSWLTGSKLVSLHGHVHVADEEPDIDDTRFEPPETPAPVFAVRAFKHAIFGTPQPPPTVAPVRLAKKRKTPEKPDPIDIPLPPAICDTDAANFSPNKPGILLTPGTTRGKKKEVNFAAHVVDNEGKKATRTGLPNNCPGKFPSPWTPRTIDVADEKKVKNRLTEAFYEAKATGTTPMKLKVRAKDDADITIDIMEPRSASGRYWKEQYISYSKKSEEETKKLIAKQRLARDYARKKDEEAMELRRQLESGNRKHHSREKEMEKQTKELREQLRLQLAENAKTSLEAALLRQGLEAATIQIPSQARATQPMESADSIWMDSAAMSVEEEDRVRTKAYLQAAVVQTRGAHAKLNRNHREQRLARKHASISRQDSLVTPGEGHKKHLPDPERSPTPRPTRDIVKASTRKILTEKSANMASSPAVPQLLSPSDFEKPVHKESWSANGPQEDLAKSKAYSPSYREAMAAAAADLSRSIDIFDDGLAPMSALSLQAEQPITPQGEAHKGDEKTDRSSAKSTPLRSGRRHKRSEAKTALVEAATGLDQDRAQAAKERLMERRKGRALTRVR